MLFQQEKMRQFQPDQLSNCCFQKRKALCCAATQSSVHRWLGSALQLGVVCKAIEKTVYERQNSHSFPCSQWVRKRLPGDKQRSELSPYCHQFPWGPSSGSSVLPVSRCMTPKLKLQVLVKRHHIVSKYWTLYSLCLFPFQLVNIRGTQDGSSFFVFPFWGEGWGGCYTERGSSSVLTWN